MCSVHTALNEIPPWMNTLFYMCALFSRLRKLSLLLPTYCFYKLFLVHVNFITYYKTQQQYMNIKNWVWQSRIEVLVVAVRGRGQNYSTLYSIHYTLYSIRYTIYIVKYTRSIYTIHYTVGVAKIFRFTCTLFWSIPTYSRTHLQSFSEK